MVFTYIWQKDVAKISKVPGAQRQWCKSLLSIVGDNLQFYSNFALFSTLRGMSLDQDFFQMSKLSEDQNKKTKKSSSLYMEHFFPRIQVQTYAQMHTRVKLLEGMQMTTTLKLLRGYSQIIGGGYIPLIPPGFGTTAQRDVNLTRQ